MVREEMVALTPGGSRLVTCRPLLRSSNHSPTGPPTGPEHPAPMNCNGRPRHCRRSISGHLAQHAIWVVSDGHDLPAWAPWTALWDDTLRHAPACITGCRRPRTVRFADDPPGLFGRPEAIQRDLRRIYPRGLVTLVVVDREGRIVRTLLARGVRTGNRRIPVELDVLDWPPGRYALHLPPARNLACTDAVRALNDLWGMSDLGNSRPPAALRRDRSLCNASVRFVLRHDPRERIHFAPLQSDLAKELLTRYEQDHQTLTSLVSPEKGRLFTRSRGALELARTWVSLGRSPTSSWSCPARYATWSMISRPGTGTAGSA